MTEKRSARIAMRRKRISSQKRPSAGGEARERASFCHRKLCPMKEKRSARIAMRRKRILSQKRPSAGGEARKRASLFKRMSTTEE